MREWLAKLNAARVAIRRKTDPKAVHDFANAVDQLGYVGVHILEDAKVDLRKLVREAVGHYKKLLAEEPENAAALNNIGVFICNSGRHRMARPYFLSALRFAPRDSHIHENLRVADILARESRKKWHHIPSRLEAGERTLVAYFDPHGM